MPPGYFKNTRKQKAKDKRSRQKDAVSDLENMQVMLWNYTRIEFASNQNGCEIVFDLESNRLQQNVIPMSEDFRYFLD